MSTLWLEYWTEDDDFCIYAAIDEAERSMTLKGQAAEIVGRFNAIYDILENKKNREDELRAALDTLSQKILAPFAKELKRCDLVRFVVFEDLIRGAFDLLLFEGTHLFLQRPVCYQVAEGEGEDAPQIPVESALLIADLTADPEEACKEVSTRIDEAEYVLMEDADNSTIKDAADQVDALVISAHGDIDEDSRGAIYLNEVAVPATVMGTLEAWIVYFDSCQQGANMRYLEAFQEDSEIQFYLGPIISNDAGDSSTRTLIWFFEGVLAHGNPIRALFDTRKRLFTFYTKERKLNLITSLNKAFAFRLYEFVEEEE